MKLETINDPEPKKLEAKPLLFRSLLWATIFLVGLILLHTFAFWNKIYPYTKVAQTDLSGKTSNEASVVLKNSVNPKTPVLTSENPKIEAQLDNLELAYDYDLSVKGAYSVGRTGRLPQKLKERLLALSQPSSLPLIFSLNQEELDRNLDKLEDQINIPATEPSVTIDKGTVTVNKGKDGTEIDREELVKRILNSMAFNRTEKIEIPLKNIHSHLEDTEAEMVRERAQNLVGKRLQLTVEFETFSYSDNEIVSLLSAEGVNSNKLASLIEEIAKAVNKPPQDAKLVFEGGKVREFTPAKDGLETNKEKLEQDIRAAIENLIVSDKKIEEIQITVNRTKPQVATGDVNNLGIIELIGRGTSRFAGSIASRVYNVNLAASRLNGTLVKPGETLSFNGSIGDVSPETGYQQAYVIKDGRTVLGDGGGVCQVSTTLFRAALNAGLPILERRAHAYRVSYYEQDSKPGLDATIYYPTTDLKIKNDTPNHMLVQAKVNKTDYSLAIELYGTSDGRVAEITTPRVWDVVPAPPPLYQDDPTLPPGTTKQVDYAAVGSKAAFDYKVTRNGEVLQNRTFYSNYRPWQAVFLRGVSPQ